MEVELLCTDVISNRLIIFGVAVAAASVLLLYLLFVAFIGTPSVMKNYRIHIIDSLVGCCNLNHLRFQLHIFA
ncbi:unnamed protein product, partial [Mesorhabditis spiculigera]